jgi:hypothetical protein
MQAVNGLIDRVGVIVLGLSTLVAGCDVINPVDPVPAYVQVDTVTTDFVQGTGTTQQKIEDVWVYLDGSLIGAYGLPATIPLIASGPVDLLIFPGIRVNGIRATADFYPFFEPIEMSVDLTPAETVDLDFHTRYRSNARIAYLEDFDTGHSMTDDRDGDEMTSVERSTTAPFEGSASGRIALSEEAPEIRVASLPLLGDLPINGSPVYLEMHYRNTVPFSVGLVGHGPGIEPSEAPILVLTPTETWNKVYVELTPALSASQLEAYQILIISIYDDTVSESVIFLDNLKIVHIDQ